MSGRPARKPWGPPDLRHLEERRRPKATKEANDLARALVPEVFWPMTPVNVDMDTLLAELSRPGAIITAGQRYGKTVYEYWMGHERIP